MDVNGSLQQLTGTLLGNYRLDQPAEQHPWGPIFHASSRQGKRYTVRFLVPDSRHTPDERLVILGRLHQEANRVATLSHAAIVPCIDYGIYQEMLYLVYPFYAHYPPLRSRLSPPSLPDVQLVSCLLEQIAAALEYTHEHAVLHRNLSTSTILLAGNQRVLINEFGLLQKHALCMPDDRGQKQDRYAGSSESCAPEQLLGKTVDTSTDVYAMGAVLYRMLTGHAPFSGQSRNEILRQHLYARVPPLSTWRSDLPVDLDHIIAKAMQKEPSLRYDCPSSLVRSYYQIAAPGRIPQLSAALEQQSMRNQTSGNVVSVQLKNTRPAKHNASRRRFVALAGAGMGTVVAVAAISAGSRLLGKQDAAPAAPQGHSGITKSSAALQKPTSTGRVLAKTADVQTNQAVKFALPNQQNPGVLIHLPDNRYVAFDSTCTHAGCAVSYSSQDHLLECPCHGAVFDPAKNAAVVQGPAPSPLNAINIKVNPDGTITAIEVGPGS